MKGIERKPVSRRSQDQDQGFRHATGSEIGNTEAGRSVPREVLPYPAPRTPGDPNYRECSDGGPVSPTRHETVDAKDVERLDNISKKRQEHVSQGSQSASIQETQARELQRAGIENMETASNEDDTASIASVDSIEQELLEFQQREAQICLDSEDWDGAEECIVGILQNSFLSKEGADEWHLKFAELLCARKDWPGVIVVTEKIEGSSARSDHLAAEAYLGLDDPRMAKYHCYRAIKVKRKDKGKPETLSDSMELMARIMDALGEKVQAKFYRSKIQLGAEKAKPASPGKDSVSLRPLEDHEMKDRTQSITIDLAELDLIPKWGKAMRCNDNEHVWNLRPDQITMIAKSTHPFGIDQSYRGSALHIAAYYDRAGGVKKLIAHGADVHSKNDAHGGTPLHIAALRGSMKAAEALLGAGSMQFELDNNGDMPIHNAIKWCQFSMVEVLMKNGADHNAEDKRGHDLVEVAVRSSDRQTLHYILENSAHRKQTDSSGLHLAHLAAHNHKNAIEVFNRLAMIWKTELLEMKTVTNNPMTTLHYAVRHGTTAFVKYLLDYGARVDATTDRTKRTALHIVLQRTERSGGDYVRPIVALLLEKGVPVNAKDYKGRTALAMLEFPRDRDSGVEALLLRYGSKVYK